MNKYFAEGIGTFFLTVVVILITGKNNAIDAPLSVSAALIGLSYAFGPISGGHFNPAVTLGALVRGKMNRLDLPYYILAQLIGSVLAALIASFFLRCAGIAEITPRAVDPFCALMAEFLGTFLWVSVFLHTSTTRFANAFYGLATGFAVLAGMRVFGQLSSAVFNPAVALGASIAGTIAWGDIWVYLLGSILGAATAGSVFQVLHPPNPEKS